MMKMKPAANLRERVKDINERLDILNANQNTSDSTMEQNHLTLQQNLRTLHDAFSSFGDNYYSELSRVSEELRAEFKSEITDTNRRLADLTAEVSQLRED
jgi:hypothetical protein